MTNMTIAVHPEFATHVIACTCGPLCSSKLFVRLRARGWAGHSCENKRNSRNGNGHLRGRRGRALSVGYMHAGAVRVKVPRYSCRHGTAFALNQHACSRFLSERKTAGVQDRGRVVKHPRKHEQTHLQNYKTFEFSNPSQRS